MKFQPRPENPFPDFIATYFDRCRAVCPRLRVIAGKWTFEDLLPGLSDFDTRLIFTDEVTVRDWADMSLAVGNVHTQLAKEYPHWARILEHLPGLNLMGKELTDPLFYYPEFPQWTFYRGDETMLGKIRSYLDQKPWTSRDELFHLKKFALYFGPYNRSIDPSINLGPYENKYPLHSRFMHYFTPPIQSFVSLMQKKGIVGKLQALRLARDIFPNPQTIDLILDAVDQHYEISEYYEEPKLTEIENRLEEYLKQAYATLAPHVTLINIDPADTPSELKKKITTVPVDPVETFYEGVKFSRFMKGRLLFYATAITWFDTQWLIRNELGRIVQNFYEQPLRTFGQVYFKETLTADEVLMRIEGSILPSDICRDVRTFVQRSRAPIRDGFEKSQAAGVAEVFEPVQVLVEKLGELLLPGVMR
ncbi:MAG: hypothetical protein WC975_13455 [Phycisphaerae bacterium]